MPVPFAVPDIGEDEKTAVLDVLSSGWLSTGPQTKKFEATFSEQVGAAHAVAVNSCTAAMHLALEALGVGAGDEVIVPTMTFAATGEVVRYFGAKPVLADITSHDHNINVETLDGAITDRTKVIIPVHFAGKACDMDRIMELASSRGLHVIEDAAHAFPCTYKGRKIGQIGDITCFSFYATKTITTGEGGMATTQNDEWADRMRIMSLHGISRDAWKRYSAEGSWYYEIAAPGYKYNMGDIAGALGLVQLSRAQEMLDHRRAVARSYADAFSGVEAIELLETGPFDDHAFHLYVIKLVDGMLSIDRDQFIEELKSREVSASVHFIPLHIHPYYRDKYGYSQSDFPVAYECYKRSISLPIYSKMREEEISKVVESVLDIVKKFHR